MSSSDSEVRELGDHHHALTLEEVSVQSVTLLLSHLVCLSICLPICLSVSVCVSQHNFTSAISRSFRSVTRGKNESHFEKQFIQVR